MRLSRLVNPWPYLQSSSHLQHGGSKRSLEIVASTSKVTLQSPFFDGQRRYRAAVPIDSYNGQRQTGGYRTGESLEFPSINQKKIRKQQTNDSEIKSLANVEGKAPRNPVGVQLLSPSLHAQLFPSTSTKVPPILPEALSLCQHHLHTHGLVPEQSSTLDPVAFDLPSLQGKDLSQHFWNLGRQAAQPWLGMAHNLAASTIFPSFPEGIKEITEGGKKGRDEADRDEEESLNSSEWLMLDPSIREEIRCRKPQWLKYPGWVRYPILHSEDGLSQALGEGEIVPYPLPEDGALSFDVETMVQESPFAVMATAAGKKAWYAWLSPWLLQQGERCHEKDHLIPFGPDDATLRMKQPARLLVGHNVGYDRARIRDEYSLSRSNIRFLDTMSLHVATRGISSPQRNAWMKHSKGRALEKMLELEDIEDVKKEVIRSILGGEDVDEEVIAGLDLEQLVQELQGEEGFADGNSGGISVGQMATNSSNDSEISSSASLLWQDVTSKNSLVDVAKLHCNINMSKESRNVFIDGTSREEIVSQLDHLLQYCATDVLVTQKVFQKVWKAFINNCPNPATTAGVLGLGSAILPVDDEWIEYINRCDAKYELALEDVRENLVNLAEKLRVQGTKNVTWDQAMEAANARVETYADRLARGEEERKRKKMWWETDLWASQLDWTPKKPKKDKSAEATSKFEKDVLIVPRWYRDKVLKSSSGLGPSMTIAPSILRLHYQDRTICRREDGKWVIQGVSEGDDVDLQGSPLRNTFLKNDLGLQVRSRLGEKGEAVLTAIRLSSGAEEIRKCLLEAANQIVELVASNSAILLMDSQLAQLDWTPSEYIPPPPPSSSVSSEEDVGFSKDEKSTIWWPKWYWDLYKSPLGQLEVTIRSKVAPLLLCVTWQGCPLHHSRQHGWVFRYDPQVTNTILTRQSQLSFQHSADQAFKNDISKTVSNRLAQVADKARGKDGEAVDPFRITPRYYKVPHLAGDDSNVGSPFSKGFLPFFEDGTLKSEHQNAAGRQAAKNALEMNAQCSYWIGVRDRVKQQMVVWEGQGDCNTGFSKGASGARTNDRNEMDRKKGIILPQVVPMGTVTRRAIEKTWLTASNAKPNRVGSELKALVKAPPGWSIVGADVDSQELWICSVMGDAQFGIHGATAIGWMTLEGSKALGTDLHSKTASILGTSRNQAKIFNYSRIYGAGIRHSSQLLLKANPAMASEEAIRKARELYANTKGTNTQRRDLFGRKFWYGGTESFVFNKLEEIALSEQPKTPALDCGVTAALSRQYLPKSSNNRQGNGDYMPSRINWVVQSSGVDYLHLLITSMEHLISTFNIQARFMISVHDEVRYLAKEEEVHRVALALQISNLWTRALFAHKLQMDNLPQGVAFFAQVDIDKILRKEADDPCITPSQPTAIPSGTAEDIKDTLKKTNGGSLFADQRAMKGETMPNVEDQKRNILPLVGEEEKIDLSLPKYVASKQVHRSSGDRGFRFLQAQASNNLAEITALEERMRLMEKKPSTQSNGRHVITKSSVKSEPIIRQNRIKRDNFNGMNKRSSPFGATIKFHTCARNSQEVDVKLSMTDINAIIANFPTRPRRWRVPFYKIQEHRKMVLWDLYRPLLKGCQREYLNIYKMIQGLTRAKRHCTSPRQTQILVDRGRSLIDQMERAKKGDQLANQSLQQQDEEIAEKQVERFKNTFLGLQSRHKSEKMKSKPRLTGGLLPPTLYNPPLLRFKPIQPDHITMMILKRRMARFKRSEKQSNIIELQRLIKSEVAFLSRLRGPDCGKNLNEKEEIARWRNSLRHLQQEMEVIEATFQRDHQRSKMTYTTSMLRIAKRARQRRLAEYTRQYRKKKSCSPQLKSSHGQSESKNAV